MRPTKKRSVWPRSAFPCAARTGRPAIQDDNDLIYRPAPAAVEQVVELHEEE